MKDILCEKCGHGLRWHHEAMGVCCLKGCRCPKTKPIPKKMTGLTVTLVFGKFGGLYAKITEYSWRVCLGWVAFTVYPRTDLETYIEYLTEVKKWYEPK